MWNLKPSSISKALRGPLLVTRMLTWVKQPLVSSQELPKWLVDNRYIISWCRRPDLTYWQCLLSVFQLHNQTMNIWTHLIGLLMALNACKNSFPSHLTNSIDIFFMALAYTGIIMSLYCSVMYHIFNTGSYEMSCFLSRLDYFGIILHLIGVMLALVYFVYYHNPLFQILYVISFIIIGIIFLTMNYHSMFCSCTKSMSCFKRTVFFVFVAFLSIPPQIDYSFKTSWYLTFHMFATDSVYFLAAIVYSMKYPEKWMPGQFDLFCSHAIFHIFIVMGGFGSINSISMIAHEKIMNAVLY